MNRMTMNRMPIGVLALVPILLLPLGTSAQDDASTAYVYASYWYCKLGPQYDARIDEVQETDAEVLKTIQEKGLIQNWGIYKHQTGGRWRRLQFHIAPTMQGLWDAQEAMGPEYRSRGPAPYDRAELCYAHEDYVWTRVTGSPLDGDGGGEASVAFSTYYVCDPAEEQRADAIVSADFASIMNGLVESGKLVNWAWLEHVIGGEYRRLYSMTAASHAAMLVARGEMAAAMRGDAAERFREFNTICPSHSDYMWDIMHSGQ